MTMTAEETFFARKSEIDELLAKLAELSNDHFNAPADDLNWSHVAELGYIVTQLKEIATFVGIA